MIIMGAGIDVKKLFIQWNRTYFSQFVFRDIDGNAFLMKPVKGLLVKEHGFSHLRIAAFGVDSGESLQLVIGALNCPDRMFLWL